MEHVKRCRICAACTVGSLAIFSEQGEKLKIAEKIARCLPIIVLPSDTLPLHICIDCLAKLNTSHNLIITAVNAETCLKANFLPTGEVKYEHVPDSADQETKNVSVGSFSESPKIEKQIGEKRLYGNSDNEMDFDFGHACSKRKFGTEIQINHLEGVGDMELAAPGTNTEASTFDINGPAICDLCDLKFSDMDEFDNHISAEHLSKAQHPCRFCDESFDNENDLLAHKLMEHFDYMISCRQCDEQNLSYKQDTPSPGTFSLADPEDNHADIKVTRAALKHQCKLVSAVKIQTGDERQQDGWFHRIEKKIYFCDCGKVFASQDDFCSHEKDHKKTNDMKCITCHKVFTNETFYKRHRYIHDPAFWDRYKCQTCNRPFRDAQALANHTQLHLGIKPHLCDLCGRTYNRYANMLKHRKLHKPVSQWEHRCLDCGARFERMPDLTGHMETSHKESTEAATRVEATASTCAITSTVATTTTTTTTAATTPTTTAPSTVTTTDSNAAEPSTPGGKVFKWICRFCGKRISTKLSLQDHERIHTGSKPFVCEWCGREFRSRPNLLQHHLTHTGDRRHACTVCGKRFARKSFIVQHMRVHTGEKPYECDICGHRFTQAGDMRRHRRRHLEAKLEAVAVESGSKLVAIPPALGTTPAKGQAGAHKKGSASIQTATKVSVAVPDSTSPDVKPVISLAPTSQPTSRRVIKIPAISALVKIRV